MEWIRHAHPKSTGALSFLPLDLADLEAVARSAQSFLDKESRLDALINNAGVMHPPPGSVTKQGHELQLGVHNLGPVLLAEMLAPLLAKTAAAEKAVGQRATVRVVWVASLYAEMGSPDGGVDINNLGYTKKDESKYTKYSISKAGVFYQGAEYARRHRAEGIVSVVSGCYLMRFSLSHDYSWCVYCAPRKLTSG